MQYEFFRWLHFLSLAGLLVGCARSEVARFQSSDGAVSILIIDPVECDQVRSFSGHVQGVQLPPDEPGVVGLGDALCHLSFDPSDYIWIDRPEWCALLSRYAVENVDVRSSVYCVVDRKESRILRSFEECTPEIRNGLIEAFK